MINVKNTTLFLAISMLAACGSSDDSSGTGFVQMYNASANSPTVYLEIDNTVRTGATFGEVTTRHNYNHDDYALNYVYLNDNDDYIPLLSDDDTLAIKSDVKLLKVLSGDYSEPRIDEFAISEFDGEDKIQISAINTISDQQEYDIYLAKDDYAFVDAELLTSTQYLALPELQEKSEDHYTFYITLAGSDEVIFQSSMVELDDEQSYIAMLRPSFSSQPGGITVDLVSDGSSVTSLTHVDAMSQMRFYNAIDEYAAVTFNALSTKDDITTPATPSDTVTDYFPANAGTFTLSMLDSSNNPIVNNFVEAVNKNTSLISIFYQHTDDYPAMISITEDLTPNAVSHNVQVVNLIDHSPYDTNIAKVDIYFTEGNETIDDTTSYIKNIDAFATKSLALDSQSYDVSVTYEVNNQTISVLQMADIDFSQTGNYILILEEDSNATSGYKITQLKTLAE
ncbi:hypothetical protein [Pseudoalteromonas spongiae]|uniref:hypothetical protein n=1 Tax=Pseudoalteromonas spongiae TaxID=298657 RepID=UPI00026CBB44|nr:hypothetical protein [Pseudoalteromonas spongiae]ATD00662.1 hypothetical protein PSPO_b0688 [Pseudoalteromonas spongiae UST010723-006]